MVRETLCLERMFQGQMHVTHEHTGCMYVCTVCIASTTRAQPLNTGEEGSEVMANLAVCAKQTNEQGRPTKLRSYMCRADKSSGLQNWSRHTTQQLQSEPQTQVSELCKPLKTRRILNHILSPDSKRLLCF